MAAATTLSNLEPRWRSEGEVSTTHAELRDLLVGNLPAIREATGTPGISVAIADAKGAVSAVTVGVADVERGTPMMADTIVRAGSMTKLYVATSVMQMVEQGNVGLYDSVNDRLGDGQPGLENPFGDREVTIEDLLTFRSGLAADTTDSTFGAPPSLSEYLRDSYGRESVAEYGSAYARWSAKVGERYQYSNCGVATLAALVERRNAEGMDFSRYVNERIIQPLGLRSTVLPTQQRAANVPASIRAKTSEGYARVGPFLVRTPLVSSGAWPANGVLTTPADHVRLLGALLRGGEWRGTRILTRESVRLMVTPRVPIGESAFWEDGWWCGLLVLMTCLGRTDFCYGFDGAYAWSWTNLARAYPAAGVAIVVAANQFDWVRRNDPVPDEATELVASLASAHVRREAPAQRALDCPWPWKVSYVVGVLLAERLLGLLGIDDVVDESGLDAMVHHTSRDLALSALWCEAGFREGLRDMQQGQLTPEAIEDFLVSDRCKVTRAEQRIAYVALGGRGDLPMPVSYWDRRAGWPAAS